MPTRTLQNAKKVMRGLYGGPRLPSWLCDIVPVVIGTTYFVSPSGDDTDTGLSRVHAFQTLQKGVSVLGPGDTLNIMAGIYQGFGCNNTDAFPFSPINGTAIAPITIQRDPQAAANSAIINLRNQITQDGIDMEGCSYIILDGIVVDPTQGSGGAIGHSCFRLTYGGSGPNNTNITVRNCTANQPVLFGIYTSHIDNAVITNNICTNATGPSFGQGHGIYVANACNNPIVTGNLVHDNFENGIQFNADVTQGGDGLIHSPICANNTIYNNGSGGGGAINCGGVENGQFYNNLLYNNHAGGLVLSVLDAASGSVDNEVVNNTIVMASDSRWCVNINGTSTGPGSGDSTGNTVFNNIMYNNNSASNRGSIEIDSGSLTGFVSDYNSFDNKLSTDGGSTGISLASWRTATGQDAHSFNSTPGALFVDSTNNDYHELSNSPSVDTGISTLNSLSAPTTDLDNNARPLGGGYDMGCYER